MLGHASRDRSAAGHINMCTLPAAVGRARAELVAPLVAAANLEGRRRAAGVLLLAAILV